MLQLLLRLYIHIVFFFFYTPTRPLHEDYTRCPWNCYDTIYSCYRFWFNYHNSISLTFSLYLLSLPCSFLAVSHNYYCQCDGCCCCCWCSKVYATNTSLKILHKSQKCFWTKTFTPNEQNGTLRCDQCYSFP